MAVYDALLRVYGEAVANSFRNSKDSSIGSAARAILGNNNLDQRLDESFAGGTGEGIRYDSSKTNPKSSLI
jgi:hypothetical protein